MTGGALSGAVLGISAGPIAARVGAGVGACIGFLSFFAATCSRRGRGPTRATIRAIDRLEENETWRSVVRCLGQVIGWLLMLTGSVAVLLTWCLMGDDRSSDSVIFGMCIFSVVVLGSGAKVVWRPSGLPTNRPNARRTS